MLSRVRNGGCVRFWRAGGGRPSLAFVLVAPLLFFAVGLPSSSVAVAGASAVRGASEMQESSSSSSSVPALPEASTAGPSAAVPGPEAKAAPPEVAPQAQGQPRLLARPSTEEGQVRELLRLTGSLNVGLQMMDKILETFRRAMPAVPAEVWTGFRSEVDPRELEDAIVPLYLASFTASELEAMLAFYHSPVGEKLLRKQPELFRASGLAGQEWAADVTYRLRARLTEKGYPPPGVP
jgi:hypothetical protein